MPIKSLKTLQTATLVLLAILTCMTSTRAQEAGQDAAPKAAQDAPVTLAHKWKAGQKWIYDLQVRGKMDIRFPAGAPMLARMSFKDMDFSLRNYLMLDVLKKNEKGEGVVAPRVANVELNVGTAQGRMELKDDMMQIFVNNQPLGQPSPVQTDTLQTPERALLLDTSGHYQGSEPIPGARPSTIKLPDYVQNLMKAFDPRILPPLWPGKAVTPGEQWTNELLLPLEGKTTEEKRIGSFEWTYVGEVADAKDANRKLQHLRLAADFKISAEQAALMAAQIGDDRPGTPQETIQKLSGDVFFDTRLGQVSAANLKMQFYSARQAETKIGDRTIDDSSWTIFDGTLQLALDIEQSEL